MGVKYRIDKQAEHKEFLDQQIVRAKIRAAGEIFIRRPIGKGRYHLYNVADWTRAFPKKRSKS